MTMKKMAMANSQLSPEVSSRVNFRIISIDPDRDTPEKMQQYAKAFNPNFSGIAGKIEIIYKLATDLTLPFVPVVNSNDSSYDMDHSMNLAVIDPEGNYFGFFKSPHTPDKMSEVLTSIVNFN
jgi:protein SCO1/2